MARGSHQKLKLLYLAKILREETDDTHALTLPEIIRRLNSYGIDADRKCLYDDLYQLDQYGMVIIQEKVGQRTYYHCTDREFELAELRMIIDAICSSKFITAKKSKELIGKLEKMVSIYDARLVDREVIVSGRVKSMNESILYTVDAIQNAIASNHRIRFQYFRWNVKGEQEFHHDGKIYEVSPWTLVRDDENYYLVAYQKDEDKIKHFRVDKMLKTQEIEENRQGVTRYRKRDKEMYSNKHFRMFGGKEETVILRCENWLANVIIDQFGRDTALMQVDAEHFETKVEVAVSDQFLAWVIALGDGATIVGPEDVVERIAEIGKRLCDRYKT